MTPFSEKLLREFEAVDIVLSDRRPRLLMDRDEAAEVREKARALPGYIDRLAEQAEAAAQDEQLFGPTPEPPYYVLKPFKVLADAAFILENETWASRVLEAIEGMFAFPHDERLEHSWAARPHIRMRCDHGMLNASAAVGLATDLCADFWPADTVRSISERLYKHVIPPYMETWEKQDLHWAMPNYHGNWKIMCSGEGGLTALACGEAIPDLDRVVSASLAGVLDILDSVPPEGDWPEGVGYWLSTMGYGLRFGLALYRATGGRVDLFKHPGLQATGDFVVHLTEPDEGIYDFGDNSLFLGQQLDFLHLLARKNRRGDWAWTARMSDHITTERLTWDDTSLENAQPADTAGCFPHTGVAVMRSGWDEKATFVGFKSGPSNVGHPQLDANSFVVSSGGERLLIDESKWPYAHHLGFFDVIGEGKRWNFAANDTVGHNTLLVDGQGQCFGAEYPGRIASFHATADLDVVVGDATEAYGGKLRRYVRTLAFVKPDTVLIYDQVTADGPRYLEWLFHHRAEVSGDETVSRFTRHGVTLSLCRLLPEEIETWRLSDVARTSIYTDTNTTKQVRPDIRYRSFGPFHPQEEMEVLWMAHVGDPQRPPAVETAVEPSQVIVRLCLPDGQSRTVKMGRIGETTNRRNKNQ